MIIVFKNNALAKLCNSQAALMKKYQARRATLVQLRLSQLATAAVLEEMRAIPKARCHELKENRKGQLAVDLDGLWRLIFEPANDPIPRKPDGGLDWTAVTAISILEIVDYHE